MHFPRSATEPGFDAFLKRLAVSPDLYPQKLDPYLDTALIIQISREEFRAASFLDDRVLHDETQGAWMPWRYVEQALQGDDGRYSHFVFHIGRCGSTLLSRMLDTQQSVLALREPSPLLTLADIETDLDTPEAIWSRETFDTRLDAFLRVWARVYPQQQVAVVKATSFCNGLATKILQRRPQSQAVAMYIPCRDYVAGAVADWQGRSDLRSFAPKRLRRLHRRLGASPWRLYDLGPAELATMSWTTEMATLQAAHDALDNRLLWVCFDDLLSDVSGCFRQVLEHFRITVADTEILAIQSHPLMENYSKAPGQRFNASKRAQVLTDAHTRFGTEVAAGMKWLANAVREFPQLALLPGTD
ncbi:MAG: hypothetical protein V3U59_01010 [Gammaproteobacteria bacterium]